MAVFYKFLKSLRTVASPILQVLSPLYCAWADFLMHQMRPGARVWRPWVIASHASNKNSKIRNTSTKEWGAGHSSQVLLPFWYFCDEIAWDNGVSYFVITINMRHQEEIPYQCNWQSYLWNTIDRLGLSGLHLMVLVLFRNMSNNFINGTIQILALNNIRTRNRPTWHLEIGNNYFLQKR